LVNGAQAKIRTSRTTKNIGWADAARGDSRLAERRGEGQERDVWAVTIDYFG